MRKKDLSKQAGRAEDPQNGSKPAAELPSPMEAEDLQDSPSSPRVAISWKVKPDGSIDFGAMREKTRQQLRAIVSDPSVHKALGITAEEKVSRGRVIAPEVIGSFWDVIGVAEAAVFSKVMHLPKQTAEQVFRYNEGEKALLDGPTEAVLVKYTGKFLEKFGEEVALAALVVSITSAKLSIARAYVEQRKAAPVSQSVPPVEDRESQEEGKIN